MSLPKEPPGDDFEIRCPKLGHPVSYSYCRVEGRELPCDRALRCWEQHFAVADRLREELDAEQWARAFEREPKPKVLSLWELIEQAKHRQKE